MRAASRRADSTLVMEIALGRANDAMIALREGFLDSGLCLLLKHPRQMQP